MFFHLAESSGTNSLVTGGILAMILGAMLFSMIFIVVIYIYTALAYKKIAEKTKYPNPNYAWIPVIGPGLISAKLAKMPNWPLYLLFGYLVMMIPFISFIGSLAILAFAVYFIIWTWKMFEGFGWPGALALLWLIPLMGLILIGILAWGNKKYNPNLIK